MLEERLNNYLTDFRLEKYKEIVMKNQVEMHVVSREGIAGLFTE